MLRRAIAIDARFASLGLGVANGSVMAVAERDHLPVLTFDFNDFRAAQTDGGPWQLVVDEARYRDSTS